MFCASIGVVGLVGLQASVPCSSPRRTGRALQLTSLDMEVVSVESKTFANTVFLKKRMYYNMRSRTVKRQAGHVIREVRDLGDPTVLNVGVLFSRDGVGLLEHGCSPKGVSSTGGSPPFF